MMARYTRNPYGSAALAPLVPYIAAAAVLYFYGDKLFAMLGARLTGKSVEEYKEDVSTVTGALKAPVTTAKDLVQYVTGTQVPSGPGTQTVKGTVIKLPYPNPQTQAEFRANIAAIDAALKGPTGLKEGL